MLHLVYILRCMVSVLLGIQITPLKNVQIEIVYFMVYECIFADTHLSLLLRSNQHQVEFLLRLIFIQKESPS
jgi:hypothetical protein